MAREAGMSDAEILKKILWAVPAGNKRRRLVVEWGKSLGLSSTEALRTAHAAGLIPSVHPPRRSGKLPHKVQGRASE